MRWGKRTAYDWRRTFVRASSWYGVLAGESKLLLNSQRDLLTLDRLPADVRIRDDGFDLCRISKEAILRFLGDGGGPDLELLPDLRDSFARFAVFRDTRVPLLLATWMLGTYCYRIFRVFRVSSSCEARISVAERPVSSTKSRSWRLTLLGAWLTPQRHKCFGGHRAMEARCCLMRWNRWGRRTPISMLASSPVLNSGFEQGGSVPRMEKNHGGKLSRSEL